MIIRGNSICLCPFDRRHFEATRTWANDYELSKLMGRGKPVSEVEHEKWLENVLCRDDCVLFAIETPDGKHVGNVWLWHIDARHRSAEVRIVIGDAEHTGRGIGTEAIRMLADYARDRMNLRRLFALVLSTNPRSRRAFEKAGFELEGTLRQDRWIGDRFVDNWILGRVWTD